MTALDIQAEYWAHYYADSPQGEEFEDDDFNLDEVLQSMEGGEDFEEVDLDDE